MSELVGTPEDRFSRVAAQIIFAVCGRKLIAKVSVTKSLCHRKSVRGNQV